MTKTLAIDKNNVEVKLEPNGLLRLRFLQYLKNTAKDLKIAKSGDNLVFICPSCSNPQPSAIYHCEIHKTYCECCGFEGSLIDVASMLDKKTENMTHLQIADYLNSVHGIIIPEAIRDKIEQYLKIYEKLQFDLVPLVKGTKECFESDWPNKPHKDIAEWRSWIENGFNIGIKTGRRSNITVIDVDTKEIPDILKNWEGPKQTTNKGYHFLFKYEEKLENSIRLNNVQETVKIDILNDEKQIVAFPSVADGVGRTWNFSDLEEIPKMPKDIYDYIFEKQKKSTKKEDLNERIIKEIQSGIITPDKVLGEGSRNNTLLKIGGIFRKKLTIEDTEYALSIINNNFVKPALPERELKTLVRSLDKYLVVDEKELAIKLLEYLQYAEEGTSQDIEKAIGEKKSKIDKALSFLLKEQYIVKRGRMYHLVKKIMWREDFPAIHNIVPFKMPYFDDKAVFNWGDLVTLGGMPGYGKTTISMNFIRRFKDQGITPHYICLETGSRFIKTACSLGLREGDFKWSIQTDPSKIEVEKNSVTIIDWLMIEDKAQTDTVLKYFVEQLVKTNSFLIIFMQLKEGGGWFAPNMVNQFPAFAARYLYDEDGGGITGYWQLDKVREPKSQMKKGTIPCRYFWEEKVLRRIDEISIPKNTSMAPAYESKKQKDEDTTEVAV